MLSSKLFALIFLLVTYTHEAFLCSDICAPNSCSGSTATTCTNCSSNWIYASGTCTFNSASGYQIVAQSSDIAGTASITQLLPSTSPFTCGSYSYYGNYDCTTTMQISLASGISLPHYAIQVIVWILLTDDTKWAITNNIIVNFGSASNTKSMANFDGQEQACGSGQYQTYYKISADFSHINSTNASIMIDLKNDVTIEGCLWGFKQSIILAKLCDPACTECSDSSASSCYSCISSKYLSGNTCSDNCLAGYGKVTGSNICIFCDPKCITCSQNSTYCSLCQSTSPNQAYLDGSRCVSYCPNTTFANSSNQTCDSCILNCLVCSDSSSCSICQTNYFWYNNNCYSICPNATYSDGQNCTVCNIYCAACNISSTNCLSCIQTGINKSFLFNNTCLATCPNGTYSSTNPNVCISCDSKCITCDVSSTNCSACTLAGGNQAYLLNLTCISSCPTGTYSTTSPNVCNSCAPQCSACTGPTASECSSCSSGNVLSNTTCDASCLTQYGPVSSSTCVYCNLNCISCSIVADNCSSCTISGANEAFLDSSVSNYAKCVSTCSIVGRYANTANHACDPCSVNCLTCSGSSSNCLSCKTGDGWLNFTCYSTCPNSYYMDGSNCTICDSKCSSCSYSSINCSVCTNMAYLLNSTCYSSCPNPYYNDNNGGAGPTLCLPCDIKCSSCTASPNTNCNSCTVNNTLSGTTCDANCLPGYGITITTGFCILCSSPCTECYLIGTNCTKCITSPSQYYLITISSSTNCVSNCPIGYYLNIAIITCIACPIGCSECSSNTNCYSCNSSYLFFNNSCYTSCPPATFQQNSTNCTSCYNECLSCVGSADNCTSCQKNGTYKSFLLQNVCFTTCPGATYGNTGDQTCKPCNAVCITCNGGGAGNCYSCVYPYIQSGGTCATGCASGYGVTSNPYTCVKCNNTCTHCAYISTNCTTCQINGTYAAFLYSNGVNYPQCLMICPNGTAAINSSRTCTQCATGCALCSNSTTYCTSCLANYGLLNFTCYSPCPNGYYLNGGQCDACSNYCLLCNNTNITCSSCVLTGSFKSYLLNYSCLVNCPAGYFKFDNSSLGPAICNPCNNTCSICSGNQNNCSSCISNYFLLNNSCLSVCPFGFFADNISKNCNDTSVHLAMSINFIDTLDQKLSIDLIFTDGLDHTTFPITTFQNITFSDPTLTLSLFKVSYLWTSSNSYSILLTPLSNIYIYNVTVKVTTMNQPLYVHNSTSNSPFSLSNYNKSVQINWFLIKGSGWSNLQTFIMNSLSSTSDYIQSITTLPAIQQINKAGLASLMFTGAQITSASILIKSVPAQNCYQAARFWANFIYFQVPKWQKNKQENKYVIKTSADTLVQNSRLLQHKRDTFQIDSLYWRFYRTGFTTFFIFDCYMQILLIALSWFLLLIAKKLQDKVKQSKISRFYSIFHALHEITIYYLSLGLILQLIYFDLTSAIRIISLIICIIFNLYYIIYQLYVYYELIKYPLVRLGSSQFRQMAKKYGYFLKRIRFEQYDDIEKWSPRHIFRPYNYHIVSFYKKYLMVIAVVLFYEYPEYAAATLILLQLFEITRFLLSWPFCSKLRNIMRLLLEIVLLIFFFTVFLQVLYMNQISQNNLKTIVGATNSYYLVGWIGFVCIFVFNTSFFIIFLYNICCFLTKSNNEEMREIRRDYYYQKILKYENCNDTTADNQILDSWVIKGDLNENWIEDKQLLVPDIDITIEKLIINKMGEGFTIQLEKIMEIEMKHVNSTVIKQKVKVREQVNGTIGLTKHISPSFFKIIADVFGEYDPHFQADFLKIKTIAKIQSKKYKSGETINLSEETHIQTLVLDYPHDEKKTYKLAVPLKGFPINPQILNPLIFNKTLTKKLLH